MSLASRAAALAFGEEGDVATDPALLVLTLASATLTTGVVLVSPLLASLTGPFGVSETRVGLFIVAFTVPQLAFIPLSGALADLVGRRAVLVPGLLVFGLAGSAVASTTSFPVALALRVVQGVGFAAAMPLTVTLVGDMYAGRRETTAQGIRMTVNYAANIVTPVLAGLLVAVSWRWPFALYAVMVPVAVAAWRYVPRVAPAEERSVRGYAADMVALLRRPLVALVMCTFLIRFVLFYGYLTYVSALGTGPAGTTAAVVGLAVAVKGVVSLVGSTQVGRLTAVLSTVGVTGIGFALSGMGVALAGLFPSVGALFVGSTLLGVGDALYGAAQKSLVTGHAPLALRAGAISVSNFFQSVGKSAVPVAMGAVLGLYGPPAAFVALGVVAGGVGVALAVGVRLLAPP